MSEISENAPPSAISAASGPRAFAFGTAAALAAAGAAWIPGVTAALPGLHFFRASPDAVVPAWGCAAAAGLLGLAAAGVGSAGASWTRGSGVLMVALLLSLTQTAVFSLHGILWEPLSAMAAMTAGFLAARGMSPAPADDFSASFRGRVSKPLLQRIAAVTDPSLFHPEQREASVVTCRMLNDGALRETLAARDFLRLSESFRACASRVLVENGGCLDPSESSGVRAFFGLPLASPQHADLAGAAAAALDDALREFSVASMRADCEPPVCGIGIATGTLTAGLTEQGYSALGDALDLSRWLASLNTNYHSRVLLDSRTRAASEKIEDRPLEVLNPPDGAAVEVFQFLGTAGGLSAEARARRDAFRDAITLLRAGHAQDALDRFQDARIGLVAADPVLDRFIAEAADQLRRDASSPGGGISSPGGAPPRPRDRAARKAPRRPS